MKMASQVDGIGSRELVVEDAHRAAIVPASPPLPSPWALRRRVIPAIARQELRDTALGWPLYVAAAVAVLIGVLLVYNTGLSVAASGLEVVSRPLYLPLLAATSLAALYLAGWATLAIARPRDQGSLRVLFFAPVDAVGLLGGHLLAGIVVYVIFMLVTIPLLLLLAAIANFPFPWSLLPGILVSPAYVAPAIALGLFISAIAPSGRGAMLLFVAVLAGVLAVQAGYSALLQIPPSGRYYDALLFLREVLRGSREALQWVSPLALMSDGLDAAYRGNARDLAIQAIAGIAGTAVWFALAAWALARRGVLP